MQMSMFLLEERPANPSRSRACGKDLLTPAGTSRSPILPLLTGIAPSSFFGRTSPAFCRRTGDGTLEPSSGAWANSGMGTPTECWTLSTVESTALDGLSLKDEGVCSLSDVLETGDVPQRYYLTPRACTGILRRAEKRGKELPLPLARALGAVAGLEQTSTATEG
jgi:hypothetical protein